MKESDVQLYFHVSPRRRRRSILANGLLTGKRRQWKNWMNQTLGSTSHVYLFSDFFMAIRWAGHMEWEFKTPIDIFVVQNPTGLIPDDKPDILSSVGMVNTWWKTPDSIAPDQITKVIPLTHELKKKVIAQN